MTLTHQIAVDLVKPRTSVDQTALSEQCGDCIIQIQAADGWFITGHYKNKMLQATTVKKYVSLTN